MDSMRVGYAVATYTRENGGSARLMVRVASHAVCEQRIVIERVMVLLLLLPRIEIARFDERMCFYCLLDAGSRDNVVSDFHSLATVHGAGRNDSPDALHLCWLYPLVV